MVEVILDLITTGILFVQPYLHNFIFVSDYYTLSSWFFVALKLFFPDFVMDKLIINYVSRLNTSSGFSSVA